MNKKCSLCHAEVDESNFYSRPESRDGLRAECKLCIKKRHQEYLNKHPEVVLIRRAWVKKNREEHKEERRASRREWYAKQRREVIEAYGNRCECCMETIFQFLAIDHRNGGGGKERKELKHKAAGPYFYRHLKKLGYPKDKYRCLCHNCNMSFGLYGFCPHQVSK